MKHKNKKLWFLWGKKNHKYKRLWFLWKKTQNFTDSTLLFSPGFPPKCLHFLIMASGIKFSYFEPKFCKHYFVYSLLLLSSNSKSPKQNFKFFPKMCFLSHLRKWQLHLFQLSGAKILDSNSDYILNTSGNSICLTFKIYLETNILTIYILIWWVRPLSSFARVIAINF